MELRGFKPDVIIAIGGGSPMDAAKLMWLMYEQPDIKFEEVAARFMVSMWGLLSSEGYVVLLQGHGACAGLNAAGTIGAPSMPVQLIDAGRPRAVVKGPVCTSVP